MAGQVLLLHTDTAVSGKNGAGNNGIGNKDTNDKVGENGTFSILGFGWWLRGLEWGFRFRSLSLGFKD